MEYDNALIRELDLLIGKGYSDTQAVNEFCKISEACPEPFERKVVVAHLKELYRQWIVFAKAVELDVEGLRGWHIELRRRLLKQSIHEDTVGTSLRVLDSLAKLQGLETEAELVPKTCVLILRPKDNSGDTDGEGSEAE